MVEPGALETCYSEQPFEPSIKVQSLRLTKRPDTFAQTEPSSSLFACNKVAGYTFRFTGDSAITYLVE